MLDLLKRSFDIFVKKRWLKEIDKAIDRHKKAQTKANREYYVLTKLVEAYNEKYNDNLWRAEDDK